MMIFILAIISITGLGFLDYFQYNNFDYQDPVKLKKYRIYQLVLQALIVPAFLYFISSFGTVAVYFILLLTWWTDWTYYAICEIFDGFGNPKYPGKGSFREVFSGNVYWASWTFYGAYLYIVKKQKLVSGKALVIQALIGILISLFMS